MMIERFETNSFCLKEKTVGGITPDDPKQEEKAAKSSHFKLIVSWDIERNLKERVCLSQDLSTTYQKLS